MQTFFNKYKKYLYIGLVLLFVCLTTGYILADWQGGTSVTYIQSSQRGGLVGYWNMDEGDINGTTVYDKSGNGRDGVSNNSPSIVDGQKKEAINFNGTDDFIEISDVSDFDWGTSKDFSIVLWFFSSTTPFTGYASLVDASNFAPRWEIGITNINQIYAQAHDGVHNATPKITNPSDGQWHQVAATFDRDGNLTLYLDVDTTQSASMISVGDITAVVMPSLFIGKNDNNNNYFNEKIDDIRIYNKALSVNEIRALYNDNKTNYIQAPPRNGLVGYWNMDSNDINGTTVYDKSGNGNNGIKSGGGGDNDQPQSVAGKLKETLDFDGYDDAITVSGNSSLDLVNNGDFSFSVWVKPNTLSPVDSNGTIIQQDDAGGSGRTWVSIDFDQSFCSSFQEFFTYVGGELTCSGFSFDDLNYGLNWVNVVVTVTENGSSDNLQFYVNGEAYNSNTISAENNNGGNYQIGVNKVSDDYFNGLIDEVRLYNRVLSQTEITNLYQATKLNYIR